MRYWGLRLGEGGKHVEVCRKGNFVAMGWRELGDTSWVHDLDPDAAQKELRRRIRETYHGSEVQVGIATSVLWRFLCQMEAGDRVLCPWPARRMVLIGDIIGSHEYRSDWGDGCGYQNRRAVRWLKEVRRETLPERLKRSLGSLLTLISLDEYKAEIEALFAGVPSPPHLSAEIVRRIASLQPKDFEEFVCHLLGLAGFKAATTRYVKDKGVDVLGTLSAEGLADIILRVQVKRVKGNVGIQEVLATRGTLGTHEHGAIVTTGGFTRGAREEAEDPNRKPIKLIDKESLVDLVLTHYGELDERYRRLLGLRRRELPLRAQFELAEEA